MRDKLKSAAKRISRRRRSGDAANSEEITSAVDTNADEVSTGPSTTEGATDVPSENDEVCEEGEAERFFRRLGMRGISALMLDRYADCPKQFEFAHSDREEMDIPSIDSAINERVRATLPKIMGLDLGERTHAAVEPTLRATSLQSTKSRIFSEADQDLIVTETRRILHHFVETHDMSRPTTARMLPLYAEVPTSLGGEPTPVELVVESVQVCRGGESIALVAYDLGDPGRFKYPIESDPMMCAWLVGAADCLRQPISEIQNVFVKHDSVERWEIREGDIEKARAVLSSLVERVRWSTDFEATPGVWCAECGYAAACPSFGLMLVGERRFSNGIF